MNTPCPASSINLAFPTSEQELHQLVATLSHQPAGQADSVRAAIYTRKSRLEPGAVHYSMEIQPDRAEELASSRGWKVVGVYADPHKTGRNSKRDGLQNLIHDIKAGKVDVVVVHRLDRLYRNLEALLKFIRLLKKHRVRLVSVTEQIDTDSPWGRLVTYVLGALAEMFIWQTSERTRESKTARMRSGLYNGNLPLGYCLGQCASCTDPNGPDYCPDYGQPNQGDGRTPVQHPVDSHAVRLMYSLYQQELSFKDIADTLNTRQFRLPGGQTVQFRSRGIPGQTLPGPFSRDTVGAILQNPFYAGMVARYASKPLDMEDDPENPQRQKAAPAKTLAERKPAQPAAFKKPPVEIQPGRHQPLLSMEDWNRSQQIRQGKRKTPSVHVHPARVYELTGVAYCWECWANGIPNAGLRGSTGNKDNHYYRCSTVHDHYKKHGKPEVETIQQTLQVSRLAVHQQADMTAFLKRHHVLRSDHLMAQVNSLMQRFVIPPDWYDEILAYQLDSAGMAAFDRQRYNLQQELNRLRELYRLGHLTLAEFQSQSFMLQQQLESLKPSLHPNIRPLAPLLGDFFGLWLKARPELKRIVLGVLFAGLYFDGQGNLRWVQAHSPFDRLLGLPEGGMMNNPLTPENIS